MPPSRQAGLRALSVGRPCALRGLICNQAPVAGRSSAQVSPTARALRPLTPTGNVPVRSTADRPNPTHYLLFTTPVLRFLRSKKLETVRGTGTLPVWGAGGEAPRPAGGIPFPAISCGGDGGAGLRGRDRRAGLRRCGL